MYRVSWPDDPTVEFHLSPGGWIRLLRRNGFEILDLVELYAGEDETRTPMSIPTTWAQRWPVDCGSGVSGSQEGECSGAERGAGADQPGRHPDR